VAEDKTVHTVLATLASGDRTVPKLVEVTPKYRCHKASGQAIVSIQGHDFYLGPWNSKASKVEYDRIISEWLAAGRQLPIAGGNASDLTIVEILARYKQFAIQHYRKDGVSTGEWENIQHAIEPLKRLYGRTLVGDFGPLALKAIQREMVAGGVSRGVINSRIGKIKRIFRWAVSEQLAPPSVVVALDTVMGLQRGRTAAREPNPVMPVSDEVVEKTLPCLPEVVADMVRFQRLTGCRPGEVCALRPRDVDRSGEIWRYVPASHKMEHRDRPRVIFIGPKARAVLAPYLLRAADAYCFSPDDTDRRRKAKLRAKRATPVQPSQVDRSTPNPKRKPGQRYNKNSYGCAIRRACAKAGVECWGPNRLRHSAATEIRSRYGLEAAQVILGHAKADVTQVYAERDLELAAKIMKEVG
jgi:integrase